MGTLCGQPLNIQLNQIPNHIFAYWSTKKGVIRFRTKIDGVTGQITHYLADSLMQTYNVTKRTRKPRPTEIPKICDNAHVQTLTESNTKYKFNYGFGCNLIGCTYLHSEAYISDNIQNLFQSNKEVKADSAIARQLLYSGDRAGIQQAFDFVYHAR